MIETLHKREMLSLLEARGYFVLRGVLPRSAIQDALRHIHLDVIRRGLPADTLGSWLWSTHWFPHLKWDPPIAGLTEFLPEELRAGELCDPQIVLQPPDDCPEQPLVPHVDQQPEWAQGRGYRWIVGIALSRCHLGNGGLVVWAYDGAKPTALDLAPGDVLVMHPDLPHASGFNREGSIRYAVYFRFLERADENERHP